jgi:hypothetical protein
MQGFLTCIIYIINVGLFSGYVTRANCAPGIQKRKTFVPLVLRCQFNLQFAFLLLVGLFLIDPFFGLCCVPGAWREVSGRGRAISGIAQVWQGC